MGTHAPPPPVVEVPPVPLVVPAVVPPVPVVAVPPVAEEPPVPLVAVVPPEAVVAVVAPPVEPSVPLVPGPEALLPADPDAVMESLAESVAVAEPPPVVNDPALELVNVGPSVAPTAQAARWEPRSREGTTPHGRMPRR
jgi:hypothetical protein